MHPDRFALRRTAVDANHPPISIADAKAALRIRHAFEDPVLQRKLNAAIELVEARTTRILRPTDYELLVTAGDCGLLAGPELDLPVCPIREIKGVETRAIGGAWVDVLEADYELRALAGTGGAVRFFDTFAPSNLYGDRPALRVTFSAGYGDAGAGENEDPELKVPDRCVELVLLLAGHWMKHREAVTSGDLAEVPLGAKLLFEELRIFR